VFVFGIYNIPRGVALTQLTSVNIIYGDFFNKNHPITCSNKTVTNVICYLYFGPILLRKYEPAAVIRILVTEVYVDIIALLYKTHLTKYLIKLTLLPSC